MPVVYRSEMETEGAAACFNIALVY